MKGYDLTAFCDNPKYIGVCPYGRPGDLLWVREAFCTRTPAKDRAWVEYKADGSKIYTWRPAIHMPRWASRLTLRLTEVRVQRVQEITDADAAAEGVVPTAEDTDQIFGAYVRAFARAWDAINAKRGYGWEANPWIWALSYVVEPQG